MSKPSFPKMINAAACSPTACTQPENRLLLSISNCRTCIERSTLNNPSPPQGEGNRPDPGSLISTLVLPPATSLCPPRTMPQPQVQSGPSQGQHLGASQALGWDQGDALIDPSLAFFLPVRVPFFSPAPIAQGVPRGARGVQSKPTPASPSAKL